MEEFLVFDDEPQEEQESQDTWNILIVDDDVNVHSVTKLALSNVLFHNKKITFTSAYSGVEALELLKQNDDFAIALIDIVMESKDAGLILVEKIRKEVENETMRLIIRTGQPGEAPAKYVIDNFDINDYKEKTELTSDKLYASIRTSLAHYQQIITLQQNLDEKVNELLETERKNEHLKRVQSKQQAQNELLSTIAHQWRQPLSAISIVAGNIKIKNELNNLTPDELIVFVDKIIHTTDQLSSTITLFRDLFDHQKIEKMVTLKDIIKNALVFFSPTLNNTNIKLNENITLENLFSNTLVQVIINLLKNAEESLIEDEIETPSIDINAEILDNQMIITIYDNGNGIKEEVQNTLFEPYTSTKELNGKGLGLFLCKNIVDHQLSGTISYENLNPGVRFTLTLPL
jgi:signal transduction histidine kinase